MTDPIKLHPKLAASALWGNAYITITPHQRSTGYRTTLLKHTYQEQECTLAEDFLVNSYLKRDDIDVESAISYYLSDEGLQTVALIDEEVNQNNNKTIKLPKPKRLELSLGKALTNRRSIRHFTGDPISLEFLSTLLNAGNGISAISHVPLTSGETVTFNQRTAASGGGLYPVQLYIASFNNKSLAKGIYRYQPLQNKLLPIKSELTLENLISCFAGSTDIFKTCSAVFILVAKPWRSLRKYGNKGLRFVFHEAGTISQNVHLAATALGIGTLDYASYYEDELHKLLQFDGISKCVLHTIIAGTPAT